MSQGLIAVVQVNHVLKALYFVPIPIHKMLLSEEL